MSASVNKPTDTAQKEADVNRKLQLYGIYNAFSNGKVPSNDQVDIALNSFLASPALSRPSDKLSEEGKTLINDTRDVVEQAKRLLLSKNEGNLIQDFIWQTTQFDAKAVNTPNAPVSKDTAKQDGNEALEGLRTLGKLIITNGQFRKLLQDSTILLRDIAGDAASNAAGKVRPSEDQLSQLDAPAEDNTWHEAPDFSKGNLKKQARGVYGGKPKEDAKDVVAAGAQAAGIDRDALQNPNTAAIDRADPQSGKAAAQDTLRAKRDSKIDPETKETVLAKNEEYRRRAQDYLDKKVPQERRDQTIWRLKKMVLECQQHTDYSQAIQTLLRLAESYGKHGRTMGKGGAGSAKEARSGFAAAEADLRTIIERFANGTSTADLWDAIGQIYRDADQDPELKNWFKSLDSYIRRCLLEQGYILEDASTQEWNALYDKGRFLLREKYRSHTDRIIDETKFIADQFDKDPLNHSFANSVQKLFKDLGTNADGKVVFKPHLFKDLTEVIIPSILENTAYIPVPRIEYTDPQIDLIVENLVLESDNFMPNVFEMASEHYFRFGRKKIANKNHQVMEVKVAGIQMDLRDVSFHVKRKKGFPSITDTGVADIFLPGDGFSFKMKVSTTDKNDKKNFYHVDKVDVDVKNLNINMKKSKHKFLFKLGKPILLKVLKGPLQKVIGNAIKEQANDFNKVLFEIKQEADRAQEEFKNNPEQGPNIYKRYMDAAQKRTTEKKAKAQDAVKDKKVNIAFTREDSIFPNIELPGGISTKATEYRELARKGDKWESPVFSIGSAKKSTNIPAAPKIERKSHPVTRVNPPTAGFDGSNTANYGNTGAAGYGNVNAPGYGGNTAGFNGNTAGTGYGNTNSAGYNGNAGYGGNQATTSFGSGILGTNASSVDPLHTNGNKFHAPAISTDNAAYTSTL